jgi:hypothetical protein
MRNETENYQNKATVGCNTNNFSLYGLIRADDGTISRLVILYIKPLPEVGIRSKLSMH